MKYNHQIRAKNVRLIGIDGKQVGVVTLQEALATAQESGVDLVEVVPTAEPPVCKVIDFGKFRYDQTKRKREGKKAQHQVKLKEVKFKPNIDTHDFEFKLKRARGFLEKGNKVRVVCFFRGREMLHRDIGEKVFASFVQHLEDIGTAESSPKLMGRTLATVIAPNSTSVTTK
ncbi:MAG: Translation initiation factor IF-3 [Chlamydiae bacterium]|nr:Translation initiation factor IF-3 [Chlamydiota bacterium]